MTRKNFQLFDVLDDATEAALRSSIQRHGVLVPVFKDQEGRILDGHQRARIANSLGVDYETRTLDVPDDDYGREISWTLNTDRRQLTIDQRRAVVVTLRAEGHSTRAIAGATGVNSRTVRRDLDESGGADAPPDRVVGLDGKSYPATRTLEPSVATTDAEIERVERWSAGTNLADWATAGLSPQDPITRARDYFAIADRTVPFFPDAAQMRRAADFLTAVADLMEEEENSHET